MVVRVHYLHWIATILWQLGTRIFEVMIGMLSTIILFYINVSAWVRCEIKNQMVLPLHFNSQYEQSMRVSWIKFHGFQNDESGESQLGKAPGGTLVRLEGIKDNPEAYKITV